MRYLAVLLLLGLSVGSAWGGEKRYVSDLLFLNLRAEPAAKAQILVRLKSDDPVELLEIQGTFAKVRTADGKQGYVAKNYLTPTPPKTQQIAALQQQLEGLKHQLASSATVVEQQHATDVELAQLRDHLKSTETTLQQLQMKYDALLAESQQLLELMEERDQLKQKNSALATEVETLQQENSALLNKGLIRWFLAGAGVLFFGWFMGKISRKNRRRPY